MSTYIKSQRSQKEGLGLKIPLQLKIKQTNSSMKEHKLHSYFSIF